MVLEADRLYTYARGKNKQRIFVLEKKKKIEKRKKEEGRGGEGGEGERGGGETGS